MKGDQEYLTNLEFSPDGNLLASTNYTSVYLWDLTGRIRHRNIESYKGKFAILFSPDGSTLVGGGYGSIELINARSGQILSTYAGLSNGAYQQINKLIFLEDGKTLVSACEDGTILLWDWDKITNREK